LCVTSLALSAHKFHGPKGCGALYINKDIRLEPLIHGGKQEQHLRAGTENLTSIIGLGKAAELVFQHLDSVTRLVKLRNYLETEIIKLVSGAKVNGFTGERLPNTCNICLPGYRGESIVLAMDQKGISLSSGSACRSGSPDPSHALVAMGLTEDEAHCSIRLSLSHDISKKDCDSILFALRKIFVEVNESVKFVGCR